MWAPSDFVPLPVLLENSEPSISTNLGAITVVQTTETELHLLVVKANGCGLYLTTELGPSNNFYKAELNMNTGTISMPGDANNFVDQANGETDEDDMTQSQA